MTDARPRFLHVGCGQSDKTNSTPYFASDDWDEVRLDISEDVNPDIVDSIIGLERVADDVFDAVYSSHNLEHVYAHEVGPALASFHRVLKEDGHLVILCPDLQGVAEHIVAGNLLEPLYHSPAGPVAPIDILYGLRPALERGHLGMAHRCGFTDQSLSGALREAGFGAICHWRIPDRFMLAAVATRNQAEDGHLLDLAVRHFPDLSEAVESLRQRV